MLAVRRTRLAMKVKWIETEILIYLEHPANAPALVYGLAQVAADSQSPLDDKINLLAKRNRKLNVIPVLRIGFGNQTWCLSKGLARAHKYRCEQQNFKPKMSHLCLARV